MDDGFSVAIVVPIKATDRLDRGAHILEIDLDEGAEVFWRSDRIRVDDVVAALNQMLDRGSTQFAAAACD